MNPFSKLLFTTILFLMALGTHAQSPEMADLMRREGKIYVVVAVILIIFLVLAVYLFWLDHKVSKIESKQKDK
jgi:uncharacterized transporter YbjL